MQSAQKAPGAFLQSSHPFISLDYLSLYLPKRDPGHKVENWPKPTVCPLSIIWGDKKRLGLDSISSRKRLYLTISRLWVWWKIAPRFLPYLQIHTCLGHHPGQLSFFPIFFKTQSITSKCVSSMWAFVSFKFYYLLQLILTQELQWWYTNMEYVSFLTVRANLTQGNLKQMQLILESY